MMTYRSRKPSISSELSMTPRSMTLFPRDSSRTGYSRQPSSPKRASASVLPTAICFSMTSGKTSRVFLPNEESRWTKSACSWGGKHWIRPELHTRSYRRLKFFLVMLPGAMRGKTPLRQALITLRARRDNLISFRVIDTFGRRRANSTEMWPDPDPTSSILPGCGIWSSRRERMPSDILFIESTSIMGGSDQASRKHQFWSCRRAVATSLSKKELT